MIEIIRLSILLSLIWGCLIASFILSRKKSWQTPWNWFPYYLLIVALIEMISSFGLHYHWIKSSQWLYNGFMPLYGLFYFYVFYHIIKLKYSKLLISLLAICFLGGIIWEGIVFGFSNFYFRSLILVSVLQLFLCGLYFFSLFKQDEYIDLLKTPAFWFTTGTLFYVAIVAATSIFFSELLKLQVKNQVPLRAFLVALGNIIMYSCWIKSFICINNKPTYTTQSY